MQISLVISKLLVSFQTADNEIEQSDAFFSNRRPLREGPRQHFVDDVGRRFWVVDLMKFQSGRGAIQASHVGHLSSYDPEKLAGAFAEPPALAPR